MQPHEACLWQTTTVYVASPITYVHPCRASHPHGWRACVRANELLTVAHTHGRVVCHSVKPGEPLGTQRHYGWMDTWINFYVAEPFADGNLTKEEQSRVLGGMAEQWSEQVGAARSDNLFPDSWLAHGLFLPFNPM